MSTHMASCTACQQSQQVATVMVPHTFRTSHGAWAESWLPLKSWTHTVDQSKFWLLYFGPISIVACSFSLRVAELLAIEKGVSCQLNHSGECVWPPDIHTHFISGTKRGKWGSISGQAPLYLPCYIRVYILRRKRLTEGVTLLKCHACILTDGLAQSGPSHLFLDGQISTVHADSRGAITAHKLDKILLFWKHVIWKQRDSCLSHTHTHVHTHIQYLLMLVYARCWKD